MRKVEAALAGVPGVASARANLSARRATAVHGAAGVNSADLVDALARAGFKAAELADEVASEAQASDKDFLKRLGVAGFAAANIMLLSVSVWSASGGDMLPSVQSLFHWLSALIALPAVAYAGQPFFRSAAQALRARRLNMDVPISLGVTLATLMSLYQTMRGSEQVYFDAAVTLLFFLLVGRFLDQRMRTRAAGAAANLLGLRGTAATVVQPDGTSVRLSARQLAPGMRIVTAAGERFAVDGRVVEGRGEVDDSLITGETTPRAVAPGDGVYAGTVNLSGALVTEATATDQNTLLAEIGRLMTAAEQARGRYVRLADRAAQLYAPAVHILGARHVPRLARRRAGLGDGADGRHRRADHHLPVRAGAGRAGGAGRRHQPPVRQGRAGQGARRAGAPRRGRHGGVRQDRHPDARRARARGSRRPRRGCAGARRRAGGRQPPPLCARGRARGRGSGHRGAPATDVREVAGCGLERTGPDGTERLGSAAWVGATARDGETAAVWYRGAGGAPVALDFEDSLRPDAARGRARAARRGLRNRARCPAIGRPWWRPRQPPRASIAGWPARCPPRRSPASSSSRPKAARC